MGEESSPSRADVLAVVQQCVATQLRGAGKRPPPDLGSSTTLIGSSSSTFDSLGMVLLAVDIEQEIRDRFGVSIVLAGADQSATGDGEEETVGSIADLVVKLMQRA